MQKMLLITNIDDLSLSLYVTQSMQKKVSVDFYFFDENISDLKQKLLLNTYDYIYFGYPFRVLTKKEINSLLKTVLANKKEAYIIDNLKTIDDIYFEDKWHQYQIFSAFMPKTQLLQLTTDSDNEMYITKERISGRAEGIFFNSHDLDTTHLKKYIIQDKMNIKKEYRIYVICNNILPEATVKSPKTATTAVKIMGIETLSPEIIMFTQKILKKNTFDFIGLDLAITESGLHLIEINRACLFNGYFKHTNINVMELLMDELHKKR